ncbi:uncharacterized protein V1516DRAFT_677117 [Lipomyces oligophaga]|uniref:uncharacterized protein n=1 Tax=Lipomyces oligophaga TaxID=45792 RepID=UPI0034CDF8E9
MQGYNKYYPPEYDGTSSLNKLAGKHSLGNRARKLNQGILTVRFELPFDIVCLSCLRFVTQGTRYNAEKKKVGAYYSTPIFSFRMKCHLCGGKPTAAAIAKEAEAGIDPESVRSREYVIEIRTDPQRTRYIIIEGARRSKNDGTNGGADLEDEEFEERRGVLRIDRLLHDTNDSVALETVKGVPDDPFAQVEKAEIDQTKKRSRNQRIEELYEDSMSRWGNPYEKNQLLRKRFRGQGKSEQEKINVADELSWKISKITQFKNRQAVKTKKTGLVGLRDSLKGRKALQ